MQAGESQVNLDLFIHPEPPARIARGGCCRHVGPESHGFLGLPCHGQQRLREGGCAHSLQQVAQPLALGQRCAHVKPQTILATTTT